MKRNKTAYITRCAIFAAILCLISPIAIPIGAVPVTLSLLAVMLAALMLDWKAAAASAAVYVLMGCIGLPVFSGMRGGAAVLVGPTGGYIWSYIPMAALISRFGKGKAVWAGILSCAGGLILCYLCGSMQYAWVSGMGFYQALGVCVVPFIGFDIAKLICAVLLARVVNNRLHGFA